MFPQAQHHVGKGMANTPPTVASLAGPASLLGASLGGYQVRALIGRGAMGTVYLARDTALNRPIALKVLLGSLARNPSTVRGFHREAQAAAPLRHPCIVRVYSAGIECGTPYIAMEYVPGEPLDRFLRRKGQVPWQTALYVGAQVAQALDCAHSNGIVHRDVKPANILLDTQGRVRLADFGIARVASQAGASSHSIIGTPAYMAPEQCEGATVSPATDLYALGVVLYQMMAGRAPFRAESPQGLIKQILADEAPRLNKVVAGIPDDVARLVAYLLEKDPAARPRSAYEVSRSIERLQKEEGGRSAIPEALASFVREQAVESSLRLVTPAPTRAPGAKGRTARLPWKVVWAVATLAAILGAATILRQSAERPMREAPPVTETRFMDSPDGVFLAQIPAQGFEVGSLRWAGSVIVVEACGRRGSLVDGATGCLTIDPVSRTCASPVAPRPWLHDGVAAPRLLPVALTYRIPASDEDSALANTLLLCASSNGASRLLAQRATDAAPQMTPVAEFPSGRTPALTGSSGAVPSIAVHPGGNLLSAIVDNPNGTNSIIEYDLRDSYPPAGSAFPPEGIRVQPGSLQYDPTGERIAYQRVNESGTRELWILSRAATEGPGTLLASGSLVGNIAFSPDGSRAAISVAADGSAAPELRLIDTNTGELLARPCRGIAGPESWHPSREVLFVTEESPAGEATLHEVQAAEPYATTPLDTIGVGIRGPAAISPDGQWLAIAVAREGGPAIAFLPFASISAVALLDHAAGDPSAADGQEQHHA